MEKQSSLRWSIVLSTAVLALTRHAEAGQLAFDKARVEAGVQVVGLAQSTPPGVAFGPRLTFNLDRRTAIDVTGDWRTTSAPAPTTLRVLLVDVRRTLAESPNAAFFATMGIGGGIRRDATPTYSYSARQLQVTYDHPVRTFDIGIGATRAAGGRVALTWELQYTTGAYYAGLRGVFGATVPLGRVTRRPDSTMARRSAFSGVPAGETAWVTMADGVEWIGEVLAVTTSEIQLRRLDGTVTLPLADVRMVKAPDSVKNGAKRGAIVGALFAIPGFLAGFELCEGGAGCAFGFGLAMGGVMAGLGAVVGAMIDSFVEGQRVVYDASRPKAGSRLGPIVGPRVIGLGGTVSW